MSWLTNYRPWYHVGHRVPKNPFDPIQVVQNLEWCRHCKMDVDTNIEGGNSDGVDVYRKRCGRCGQTMQYGIGMRHVSGESKKPLSAIQRAIRFVQELGSDRR